MIHLSHGGDIICARYTVFTEDEIIEMKAIIAEVSRKFGDGAVKMGEIYPTNTAPVLTLEDNHPAPIPVAWGFPKWDGKGVVINARAETAAEKPMFREALQSRRCVIPSTGFFEWRHIGNKEKEKYLLNEPGKGMLYMAGMIGSFKNKNGEHDAFTILTTAANESVAPLHDRMPVILQAEEIEAWLRDGAFVWTVLDRICPALTLTPVTAAGDYEQTSLF